MIKSVVEASHSLGKIDSFKYFAFLSAFTLMLDIFLVYQQGISVLDLNLGFISENISIGNTLVFVCIFSLFNTFFVSSVRILISTAYFSLPLSVWRFFNPSEQHKVSTDDKIFLWDLRSFALKNDNSVALQMAKEKTIEVNSEKQLERYSLSFLLLSAISWFFESENTSTLVQIILSVPEGNSFFSERTMIIFFAYFLYISVFYLGVIRGCGFISSELGDQEVYIVKHEIKTNKTL